MSRRRLATISALRSGARGVHTTQHALVSRATVANLALSDGLRMMRDVSRQQNRPLTERDIIEAAWRLLPMLDIHPSVWFEGQSTLGDHGSALCLLLVDAGRDHPTYPVRNPGGLMREMIPRAKAKRLDINAGLVVLKRRRADVLLAK